MKTTEEKNRMIAEFMGYKFDIENKCEIIEDFDIVENIQTYEVEGGIRIVEGGYVITRFLPEQMRYHTSWDWLMPVVFKICEMKGAEAHRRHIVCMSIRKDISFTYNAVVEFIEWYNENNKKL